MKELDGWWFPLGISNAEGVKWSDVGSVLRGDGAGLDALVQFYVLPYDYQGRTQKTNTASQDGYLLSDKKLLFDYGGARRLVRWVQHATLGLGHVSFWPRLGVETTYQKKMKET